jgi:hypothetical protein
VPLLISRCKALRTDIHVTGLAHVELTLELVLALHHADDKVSARSPSYVSQDRPRPAGDPTTPVDDSRQGRPKTPGELAKNP